MKRTAFALPLYAALALPAWAAEEPVIVFSKQLLAASGQADAWSRWAEDFSRDMRASMGTLYAPRVGSHKLVKGAPYSAEVVTEVTQTLSDGNTISRRKSGMIYRDAEGRTRQETAAEGKSPSVHINDPVEGKMYILNPGSKKAIVVPSIHRHEHTHVHKHKDKDKQVFRVGATEVRIENGKIFVDGKEAEPGKVELTDKRGRRIEVRDDKVIIDGKEVARWDRDADVVVKSIESPDGTRREEVRVQVVRGHGVAPVPPVPPVPPTPGLAPMPPMPPMPGVQTMRFESTAKLGKGVAANLGTRNFEGVSAEGKSTTWTIPAGEIGNRNPIHIVSETWYSPDLQVTVQSRYNDPRTGETVYRLANIRRGEPSPELFKVPDEYEKKPRGKS